MLIYTLPFIAALIGWFTNYIAIKMLFHPRKPMNLGLFKLQGIFPKRQKKLAERLGKVVGQELFSFHDLKVKLENPDNIQSVKAELELHIDVFLRNKLMANMPLLSMFISDEKINKIKRALMDELDIILPKVINKFTQKMENELNIEQIVYEKIVSFSTDKLEGILFSIMKKEFRFIEIVGAILGFIIGVIQVVLVELSV